MVAPVSRRERKKAATRKAISDAATRMFMERGFDEVSIREIADVADVSPTTVFAHFPQKEALIFDEDDEQREQLVAAVRNRPEGMGIAKALRAYYLRELRELQEDEHGEGRHRFMALVDATPALRDYGARMWLRHEVALAEAIAEELGLDQPDEGIRAFSRFVLQIQLLATQQDDAASVVDAGFTILEAGWGALGLES